MVAKDNFPTADMIDIWSDCLIKHSSKYSVNIDSRPPVDKLITEVKMWQTTFNLIVDSSEKEA